MEQAAGLRFNLPTEIGDLAFQFCDMGLRDAFLRLTSLSCLPDCILSDAGRCVSALIFLNKPLYASRINRLRNASVHWHKVVANQVTMDVLC